MNYPRFYLHLELNLEDVMVYSLQYDSEMVAIGLFEDLYRKADLNKDFQELDVKYYESDDHRNVVRLNVFMFKKDYIDNENALIIDAVFEELLELRKDISVFLKNIYDESVVDAYLDSDEKFERFYNAMSKYCESDIRVNNVNHLNNKKRK